MLCYVGQYRALLLLLLLLLIWHYSYSLLCFACCGCGLLFFCALRVHLASAVVGIGAARACVACAARASVRYSML